MRVRSTFMFARRNVLSSKHCNCFYLLKRVFTIYQPIHMYPPFPYSRIKQAAPTRSSTTLVCTLHDKYKQSAGGGDEFWCRGMSLSFKNSNLNPMYNHFNLLHLCLNRDISNVVQMRICIWSKLAIVKKNSFQQCQWLHIWFCNKQWK